ncbi:hypothetical protein CEXT_143181 [Caerostris extrusa]|uniref:BTB domain-containing protein n=1 Tax=Caerostris extrusa TaxID=172846 RepID=A0AAV4MAP9_CAEEX|nr:hypothetical protein CEXT_143181 [Caerostris extrusa]
MLQSDMKEKAQDCIHIEDVDADTVRRLLLYKYTDACEDLQWRVHAANACEALMIADLHQDEHLKSATSEFILKHDKRNIQFRRVETRHTK